METLFPFQLARDGKGWFKLQILCCLMNTALLALYVAAIVIVVKALM